jgi:hypothetical protein
MQLLYEWPKETWAMRLAALLAGKALEAYARMDRDESKEYIKVKPLHPYILHLNLTL